MDKEQFIKNICFIPVNFWTGQSIEEKEKWYSNQKENQKRNKEIKIKESEIENYLKGKNEIINAWLSYSQDRRGGSGFYFDKKDDVYISGYLGGFLKKPKIFIKTNEAEKACASFIKNELKL